MLDKAFFRFLIVGTANTLLGYVIYFLANLVLSYQFAFTLAYIGGLLLSYYLNSGWVFHSKMTWRSMLVFPLVYVVQYATTLGLLHVFVELLKIGENISYFVAVALTIPVSFLLSKKVFKWVGESKLSQNN